MKIVSLTLLLLCAAVEVLPAQQQEIQKGNKEFESGRFRNAETEYRNSLSKDPRNYVGNYNLGSSLYRQNKFEEAASQYMNSGSFSGNNSEKARSMYNLGNAMLKAEKYQESIDAYKQSLKINPGDEDARYNLAYAMARLKQQQQEQKKDKDKDKDKNKKDQQQQQDQQKQDKQQQEKNKENRDQQQQQQQQQGQQKQPQPKLSREEAERMLQALKNDEKNLQKQKAKKFQLSVGGPRKNW